MERNIPNLDSFCLSPIVGDVKTEENYKNQIYKFERNIEKGLLDIFKKLGMNVIVKTDLIIMNSLPLDISAHI